MIKKLTLVILISGLLACGERDEAGDKDNTSIILDVWAHSGQESERSTLQEQVSRFNTTQNNIRIELTFIPERTYNAQAQAAALAGDLPDLLEFDGPYLYRYAWQGYLVPLDDLLVQQTRDELLPSILKQGEYQGRLYSVGIFDSGLGIYARRSMLQKVGARIPQSPADAWSAEEFDEILTRLAQLDPDGAVLDLKLNYPDEWYTYAFSPLIQSAGGDLINRQNYLSAEGYLNSDASVIAMKKLQSWISNGYVDSNVDDSAFVSGRVALSWVGHWEYRHYSDMFQDDLLLLPLPDFGKGMRTGQGSWSWGITRNSRHPQAAAKFLEFLLQTKEVLAMANANGAVPATRTAIRQSDLYGPDAPLQLFADQLLGGYSVPRPRTPAYPVISNSFQKAFRAIRDRIDVKQALDEAVRKINQDIEDNRGYPDTIK